GTRATRRSPGAVSLATPTFMAPPDSAHHTAANGMARGTRWDSGDRIPPRRPLLWQTPRCEWGLAGPPEPDDDHRSLVLADDLGIVRDRPVPADVIAGANVHDVIA